MLDSIADSNNYLNFNAGPVRRMIRLLHVRIGRRLAFYTL